MHLHSVAAPCRSRWVAFLPAPCVCSRPCARLLSRRIQSRALSTAPCERGRVLVVTDVASALAEGTAGIEPAGEAEKPTTAKSETLAPWMQGDAGPRPETLPQDGGHKPEPPRPPRRDPKRGAGACTRYHGHKRVSASGAATRWQEQTRGNAQVCLNAGGCEPDWLPRETAEGGHASTKTGVQVCCAATKRTRRRVPWPLETQERGRPGTLGRPMEE